MTILFSILYSFLHRIILPHFFGSFTSLKFLLAINEARLLHVGFIGKIISCKIPRKKNLGP